MKFYQRNEQALNHEKDIIEKQVAEWGVGADMLYLNSGSTMVRILPPYSDKGVWFRGITRHRVRTGGQNMVCACPAASGLSCLICEKAQELKDSGDPNLMKFAKDNLRPSQRFIYNVLVYSASANKRGQAYEFGKVYVLDAGIMVHRQLVNLDTDALAGWADITNTETGVNVVIKRTGNGLDTKYEVMPSGHGRSNIWSEMQARGVDLSTVELVNLDNLYQLPPEDKQKEIVIGLQIVGSTLKSGATFQVPNFQPIPVPFVPQLPQLQPAVPIQVIPGVPVQPTQTFPAGPNVMQPTTTVVAPEIPAPPSNTVAGK